MINFKTFLNETTIKKYVISKTFHENNGDFIDFLKKNCSNSLWMFDTHTTLWRGDNANTALLAKNVAIQIDLSSSERKSQNTTNWYTLIIDNNPAFKGFPKRSKSLICSGSYEDAASFTKSEKPDAIIPFNSCKIGSVNSSDMWNKKLEIGNGYLSIEAINNFYNNFVKYGLRDTSWESFIEFDKNLARDHNLRNIFIETFIKFFKSDKSTADSWAADFVKHIQDAYTPEDLNLQSLTPAKLKGSLNTNSEYWISGKVIIMNGSEFLNTKII